jgi:Domain of unknown function (DUF4157)
MAAVVSASRTPAPAVRAWQGRPMRLQRKCGCGVSSAQGECESCKDKRLQRRAAVGRDDHPLEAEADRAAGVVLADGSAAGAPPPLTRMTGADFAGHGDMPDSVQRTLSSGGRPLDRATRDFMEPRFAADFSRVRVHHDSLAGQSASDVQARAYTVGSHIVFGAGEYGSRGLLAHELAHAVQQGGAPRQLQRLCLPAADCAAPRATLTTFVEDTEKKPENISKADKRQKDCTKVPRAAKCTSDGHGAAATALTALLNTHYKSRLGHVTGVFVNKDMPADWGAVTQGCSSFMPPLPGGKCTFVPDVLEAQAKQFNGGAKTVGGQARDAWLTDTLGTLTHETEHARFDTAPPIAKPNATACKFEDHASNLSEMAAHLSEMHVFYREALTKTGPNRFKRFEDKFAYWVTNGSEDIAGIVKDLRCHCECADADHYITKTAESVASNQKWDSSETFTIHAELSKPKWKLNWPVKPAGIVVAIADIPGPAAQPFKLE